MAVNVTLATELDGAELVSCRYDDGAIGTHARISADEDWIRIVSDDHEGHVMLHIEALPHLQAALERIAQGLKK